MRHRQTTTAMALALMAMGLPAWADMDAAKAFLDAEIGDVSSLVRSGRKEKAPWVSLIDRSSLASGERRGETTRADRHAASSPGVEPREAQLATGVGT